MHPGGQNVDQMKRPKRPRRVAQAVLPQGKWRKPQIIFGMGGSSLEPNQKATRGNRSETGSDPDLSTPDELEGDNMRVRKLKSRLITFGTNWDVYDK